MRPAPESDEATPWRRDTLDVLTLGETLACLTPTRVGRLEDVHHFDRSIGGAESNTAVGLARLGHRVAWISRVGQDPFGTDILRTLRGEGVDVTHVRRVADRPTGLMVKEFRTVDEVHVHYYRCGSAAASLTVDDIPEALLASVRRVHVTGITLALGDGPRAACRHLLRRCRDLEIPVSLDPNIRLKLWDVSSALAEIRALLPFVTELLLNEQEAKWLTGLDDTNASLEALSQVGPKCVVIKQGDRGATGEHAHERVAIPAVPAPRVVDTVGAGDAFNAGFLSAQLGGHGLHEAMALGAWAASHVVRQAGDYEGFPDANDFEAWRHKGVTVPPVTR